LSSVQGDWSAASAEASIRDFAQAGGHKLGAVAQPLRAALTGAALRPACSTCLPCWAARKAWRALEIKSIRSELAQEDWH